MLDSGVVLGDALELLWSQEVNPGLQNVLHKVKERLYQGDALSEAMTGYPRVFPTLILSMVKIGEMTGHLTACLDRCGDWTERDLATQKRLKSALIYPFFVLGLSVALAIALFAFVIPKFLEIFSALNVELPWISQVLIWLTELVGNPGSWLIALAMALALSSWLRKTWTHPKGRLWLTRGIHALPVLGPVYRLAGLSRLSFCMKICLDSGTDLAQAVSLSGEACTDALLQEDAKKLLGSIYSGSSLSEHLEENADLYGSVVVGFVSAGEEAADLASAYGRASDWCQSELEQRVQVLLKLMEPIFLFGVATGVGTVLLAVFLPLYSYLGSL